MATGNQAIDYIFGAEQMRNAAISQVQSMYIAKQEMDLRQKESIEQNALRSRELTIKEQMLKRNATETLSLSDKLAISREERLQATAQANMREQARKNREEAVTSRYGALDPRMDPTEFLNEMGSIEVDKKINAREDFSDSEGAIQGLMPSSSRLDSMEGPSLFDDSVIPDVIDAEAVTDNVMADMEEGEGQGDSSTDAFNRDDPDSFALPTDQAPVRIPSQDFRSAPEWTDERVDQWLRGLRTSTNYKVDNKLRSPEDATKEMQQGMREGLMKITGATYNADGELVTPGGVNQKALNMLKKNEEAIRSIADEAEDEEKAELRGKYIEDLEYLGLTRQEIAIKFSEAAGRKAQVQNNIRKAERLTPIIKIKEAEIDRLDKQLDLLSKTKDISGAITDEQVSAAKIRIGERSISKLSDLYDIRNKLEAELSALATKQMQFYDLTVQPTEQDLGEDINRRAQGR